MSIYEASDKAYAEPQGCSRNEAVLVNVPRCVLSPESKGSSIVRVEHGICQTVDISKHSNNQGLQFFKTNVKAGTGKKEEATELKELQRISHSGLCQSSSQSQEGEQSDHDSSDEDSYDHNNRYEMMSQISQPLTVSSTSVRKQRHSNARIPQTTNGYIYLLGKRYRPDIDFDIRRSDENSLFWFTYRCDFPSMDPYGITSDAGWGCMLRASQMLLAQALRLHYKGRDWRPPSAQNPNAITLKRSDPFIRGLLTWFADFPSSSSYNSGDCFYSLHNMVAIGLTKYDKLPGEWYGPGTACYVLRELVHRHEKQQEESLYRQRIQGINEGSVGCNKSSNKIFRVYVASSQGTVYKDEISKLMTRDCQPVDKEKSIRNITNFSHPLELSSWEIDLADTSPVPQNGSKVAWDTSLLLLIPLRLGLKKFSTDYIGALAHMFSLPQSVGVLGGRPRGARWFVGAHTNENNVTQIFGLDPHTVQTAPNKRLSTVNGITKHVVELSDDYLQSVHTTFIETFSLDKLDPSVALGFYCRDHLDLENLLSSIQVWRKAHPTLPELFQVENVTPNYENDDMILMNDDINDVLVDDINTAAKNDESDDDDYVLL